MEKSKNSLVNTRTATYLVADQKVSTNFQNLLFTLLVDLGQNAPVEEVVPCELHFGHHRGRQVRLDLSDQ